MEAAVATLCEKVRILEGQTMPTVTGRATFHVTSVDDKHVEVVPRSTGKTRSISCQEFERAESLGLVTASVSPSELREAGASEANPTYVAAIIRAVVRGMTPA